MLYKANMQKDLTQNDHIQLPYFFSSYQLYTVITVHRPTLYTLHGY